METYLRTNLKDMMIFFAILIIMGSLVQGETSSPNTTVGARSRAKCKEYAEYVYEIVEDPVALFNPQTYKRNTCTNVHTAIVGGALAERDEFPHMALIGWSNSTIKRCGGSIISENFVLTATHCLETEIDPDYVLVGLLRISEALTDRNVQRLDIKEYIKAPSREKKYNDIALLKLSSNIRFSPSVRPACLYVDNQMTETVFIATGWGQVEFSGHSSDELRKVNLFYYPSQRCNEKWKHNKEIVIIDSQLCANSPDGNDTCTGDSGGPLQLRDFNCIYRIVGITSFGIGCGSDFPAVYTRVSSYIKWIEDIVWPNQIINENV